MFLGLLLFLWVACCVWSFGDQLSVPSAFCGAFFVIALDIFSYGMNSMLNQLMAKIRKEKVIVHGRTYEIDSDQDDSAE